MFAQPSPISYTQMPWAERRLELQGDDTIWSCRSLTSRSMTGCSWRESPTRIMPRVEDIVRVIMSAPSPHWATSSQSTYFGRKQRGTSLDKSCTMSSLRSWLYLTHSHRPCRTPC
ncbi:hypothetical protein BDV10DRAFT_109837 [Aspergillus recurvatus]